MLQAGTRGLRIFRKGGDLQMGFPGTREGGGAGGGNGAILGVIKGTCETGGWVESQEAA